MGITLPTPCTREDVKLALDAKQTARSNSQIDDSIEEARDSIEGLLKRRFYTKLETAYFDWPNFQWTYPWTVYFDERELADITGTVPVVISGGTAIPNSDVFFGPWNYSPPYTFMELNRASNSSFGHGNTPQREISVQGAFGYWDKFRSAGTLSANISDTTTGSATVSNGAAVGVGDVLLCGTERMLVVDKTWVSSTQTQQGTGCSTAAQNDNLLGVTDGTKFSTGEVVLLDAETMLITGIAGNNLIVKRAWDGSTLATHSGATVYASRTLTVTRGDLGSTAATHTSSTALSVAVVPSGVKALGIAEALNSVLQKQGGYSRAQGSGNNKQENIGVGLDALRAQALEQFGRKARTRTV